jgi:hypothetical protein
MALRIEDNVDGTLENVNQAQAQLLKYLNTISSNRWLILKARTLTSHVAARPAAPALGSSRAAPLQRAASARPPRALPGSQPAPALLRRARVAAHLTQAVANKRSSEYAKGLPLSDPYQACRVHLQRGSCPSCGLRRTQV